MSGGNAFPKLQVFPHLKNWGPKSTHFPTFLVTLQLNGKFNSKYIQNKI